MVKTCIVLSPPISVGTSIAEGFRRCGWDAKVVTFYAPPRHRRANPVNWLRTPDPGRDLAKRFDTVFREVALPLAERCTADLLLVVRPDEISDRTRDALKKYERPVASWIMDSLRRYPSQNALAPFTVADFLLDGADAEGPKSHWLPLGVNEGLLPTRPDEKEIDVLFIGNLARPLYETRRRCFEELARSSIPRGYRCAAVVSAGGRIRDTVLRIKAPFPVHRSVPMKEYVEYISRAKICINVLPDDGAAIINDAFYLVPASNACQLADRREYLSAWLVPEKHFCWFGAGAMTDRLIELLRDDHRWRQVAEAGRREALSHHTFRSRAEQVIRRIGPR